MRILLRGHRTIAIRTYSVPDLEESQGLFTSIERIGGSTGSCAAHALTWRSRPCMALGKWIQQWLQIVAEIVTEHPNVVTRLLWPCTRCFVDNLSQSHPTPPYKGKWAMTSKCATTQSSPTPTHPAHNPHPRPAWGDVHSPERSFSLTKRASQPGPLPHVPDSRAARLLINFELVSFFSSVDPNT